MNPTKLILIIVSVFSLSACALETLKEGLPRLQGQHIDNAIHYLGLPDDEKNIAGRKVYIWGHEKSGTYLRSVTNHHTYTGYGYGSSYTAYGTSSSLVPESYNYSCTIKMVVDKKEIIQNIEYNGNEGGCDYYASGVKSLIKDTTPTEPAIEQTPAKTTKKSNIKK